MDNHQKTPVAVDNADLLAGTITVVSAFLKNSSVSTESLEDMIREVHSVMVSVSSNLQVSSENLDGSDLSTAIQATSEQFGVAAQVQELAQAPTTGLPEAKVDPKIAQFALPLASPDVPAKSRKPRAEASSTKAAAASSAANSDLPAGKAGKVVHLAAARAAASPAPVPAAANAPVVTPVPAAAAKRGRKPLAAKNPAEASVRMNAIVCLEDNTRVSDLAAYLFEKFDMTPDEYRAKWGLDASYPMHAPNNTLKRGDQFEIDPVTNSVIPLRG
jgi:predicted transcriptional regulator